MRLAWLLAAAFLLLPGCLQSDAQSEDDTPAEPVQTGPLVYEACTEHIAAVPVPWDDIAGGLPEGFSPVPFDDSGATATGVVLSLACAVDGETVQDSYIMAQVEPPADLADPDAAMHVYMYGGLSTSPATVAYYTAMGAPLQNGSVSIDTTQTAAGRVGAVRAEAEGVGAAVDTAVAQPATEAAGSARVFFTDAEEAVGAFHVAWTEADSWVGTSNVRFSGPDSPIETATYAGIGVHNAAEDYTITATPLTL